MKERVVAAVDLGSNSFHMTIAKLTQSGFQVLVRDRERVQLASGLSPKNLLDKKTLTRAVEALARFDSRLSGVATEDIRVVATHVFREARNIDRLLDLAQERFRAPINVISGPEEARLIFQAVAHTQSIDGRFLVFDIGGGSTEFAVGKNFETEFLSSRTLGCATLTNRLMKKVNKKTYDEIELITRKVIEPIASPIRELEVDKYYGTSGSAKGVSALGNFLGYGQSITPESLEACKHFTLKEQNRRLADIPDVSVERMRILPAGIGIMSAIFNELQISQVHFCDAALQEGVLYDIDDRLKAFDLRERTTLDLVKKYGIDINQASRLRETTELLFAAVAYTWKLKAPDHQMLIWAAMLHEIGLQVNYSAYQRHGAYIIMNTPLPGFSREEQSVLASLIRHHRKSLRQPELPDFRYWRKKRLTRLIRVIRIAHAMHVGRHQTPPKFGVRIDEDSIHIKFERKVSHSHPVMLLDLEEEAIKQGEAGYNFMITCDA